MAMPRIWVAHEHSYEEDCMRMDAQTRNTLRYDVKCPCCDEAAIFEDEVYIMHLSPPSLLTASA